MHKVCLGQAKYILSNQITLDFPEKSVTLASLSISAQILHPDGNKVVPRMAAQEATEGFLQALTSCELTHFLHPIIANCGSRTPAHDVRIFQKYKDWCTFYSYLIQQWWFALAARWQTL